MHLTLCNGCDREPMRETQKKAGIVRIVLQFPKSITKFSFFFLFGVSSGHCPLSNISEANSETINHCETVTKELMKMVVVQMSQTSAGGFPPPYFLTSLPIQTLHN